MAEITIPMGEFRQIATERDAQIFESADAVAMAYGTHLLKASKKTSTKLFRRAIPMLAIGYSGIAKWEMELATPRKKKHKKRSKP